jgi:hypothetical protein
MALRQELSGEGHKPTSPRYGLMSAVGHFRPLADINPLAAIKVKAAMLSA